MIDNIVVVAGSTLCLPLANFLLSQNKLEKVLVSKQNLVLSELFTTTIPKEKIGVLECDTEVEVTDQTDLVVLFSFPFKVKNNILPTIINIHFGSLPENRGADPVFWTLNSRKNLAYIAIHEVNDQFDAGDVILEKGFDILPGETWGFLNARLSQLVVPMVEELLKGDLVGQPQDEAVAVYNPKPTAKDLTIDWTNMSVFQVERLVNACNPKYGGATTFIQGGELRILEVRPAQVNMAENEPEPKPGTVVHCSVENGLFVACKGQQFLQLMVLSTNEGIFSGHKMATFSNLVGVVLG